MKRRRNVTTEAIRRAGNCTTCNATGHVSLDTPLYFRLITCPACEGTGRGH